MTAPPSCECGGTFNYSGECNGCGTYIADYDQAGADEQLLAGVRDGEWLGRQDFPPLRWAVPDLIPEGLTFLAGPPKIGKSWFVVDVLLGMAAGGATLGHIRLSEPRKVFYFALEDGDRRMQDRCRAIYGDAGDLPANFNYITHVPRGEILATVQAWLRRNPDTALVVIDTLGKVMPRAQQGESGYERDYRIGEDLKRIADEHPGLALVVIHHTRKQDGSDFVDAVSGTAGLAGSADSVIVLRRPRGSAEGTLHVTGRDVPEGEYALRMVDGRFWRLDGRDLEEAAENARCRQETGGLSEKSADIIEFVRQHPDGATTKQVTDKFGPSAREYLRRRVDEGRLKKAKRGLYVVPSDPP